MYNMICKNRLLAGCFYHTVFLFLNFEVFSFGIDKLNRKCIE